MKLRRGARAREASLVIVMGGMLLSLRSSFRASFLPPPSPPSLTRAFCKVGTEAKSLVDTFLCQTGVVKLVEARVGVGTQTRRGTSRRSRDIVVALRVTDEVDLRRAKRRAGGG